RLSAKLTNEFMEKSQQILEESEINKKRIKEGKLPANVILTRDAGDRLPKFPSLKERWGVNFGCFVEMPVERGIALLTGMEIVDLPLPAGDFAKDYSLRAEKVLGVIDKFDGLYVHLKGPDEPAHDGNFV
ncbi:MAG: phosphoglycerate mutase, partial [Candidatus Omnitrophica bacterium]|nr:phosphoglycerate mutase [Candidatus Omnitrophota bacterium]